LQLKASPFKTGEEVRPSSRASLAPVRASQEAMDYVKDGALVVIDDFMEGRRFLEVFKSSVKRSLAIDSSTLPTTFEPEKSHSFSAPLIKKETREHFKYS